MVSLFDGKKVFEIENISGGRVVIGGLSLPNGDKKIIETAKYSQKALEKINEFVIREFLKVNYDVKIEETEEVLNVEHIKGEETSKDAVVYNPNKEFKRKKAIEVEAIETGKALEVQESINESKSVEVEEHQVVADAKGFLDQHWKKIEAELKEMSGKEELTHILKVANQLEIKGKKLELIEERLGELE